MPAVNRRVLGLGNCVSFVRIRERIGLTRYIRGNASLYFSRHIAIVKPVRLYWSGPASWMTPVAARCFNNRASARQLCEREKKKKLIAIE